MGVSPALPGVPPGRSHNRGRSARSGFRPPFGDPGGTPGSAGGTPALPGTRRRFARCASAEGVEFVEGAKRPALVGAGPELVEGRKVITPRLNHRFSQPLHEKCFTFISGGSRSRRSGFAPCAWGLDAIGGQSELGRPGAGPDGRTTGGRARAGAIPRRERRSPIAAALKAHAMRAREERGPSALPVVGRVA
jgi:hypothetical protein